MGAGQDELTLRFMEFSKLMARLKAAYPRQPIEPETMRLYAEMLMDLDLRTLERVIRGWIKTEPFFPTVAELRSRYAELVSDIPPVEAAELQLRQWVRDPSAEIHPLARKLALQVGEWDMRHGDRPEQAIAAWRRAYEAAREQELRRVRLGEDAAQLAPGMAPNGSLPGERGKSA